MDTKELIGQHGKSVALVFKSMNIKAPVTAANVMLMTGLYKDKFIDALVAQVENEEEYSSFEDGGIPFGIAEAVRQRQQNGGFNSVQTLPDVTVTAKKKKKINGAKVKNTLMDIIGLFSTGYGAYKTARGESPASNIPSGDDTIYRDRRDTATDPPPQKKKPNYLLIGGIVLIVVLAVVIIFKKK